MVTGPDGRFLSQRHCGKMALISTGIQPGGIQLTAPGKQPFFVQKWDGVTDATALLLSGQGFFDFRTAGNEIPNNAITPTGDVLLSTKNFANGDNYSLVIEFR